MREQKARLIFLDETSTNTKMTRTRGRFQKGLRLNSKAPFGHWCTQTLIAGLRSDGLVAPFVVNAPINRVIFETYVETQLAPGDVVILDNLAAHKSEKAESILRARGAWFLFLPPRPSTGQALLSRPQSHRNGLLQTQSPSQENRCTNNRRPLESHRRHLQASSPEECSNYFNAAG
jgi:hypothetical protein